MEKEHTQDEIVTMNAHFADAQAAHHAGRHAEALARFEESVEFARERLPSDSLTLALQYRGADVALCSDNAIAVPLLREYVKIFRAMGNQAGLAHCLFRLGECLAHLRQFAKRCLLLAKARDQFAYLGMTAEAEAGKGSAKPMH